MKINDKDRRDWVLNDEGLYLDQRRSKLSMREYIRQNRELIDKVINNVVDGKKPAHYLAYGG